MTVVIIDAWVVTALVEDPLFFAWSKLPLELPVVLADHALEWIIVAVTEVIGSLRNPLGSLDIVGDQSQAVWTKTLEDFSVETSILLSRVGPVLVFELQFVIEEVISFNELAFVPFGDVTATVWIDERSFSMEFSLAEVAFVNNAVGEGKLAITFLPVVSLGPLILTA
jgi:hypothetical protein